MPYYGSWKIDDVKTFTANTHNSSNGAAAQAGTGPTYRVYEDETSAAILTGTMTLLDTSNTVGFYSEAITLSAGNGFEKGKSYNIYITAVVQDTTGTMAHNFQIEAEVDVNVVSAGAITSTAFAADAILSTAIGDNALTANKIATGALSTDQLTAGVFTKVWAESTRSITLLLAGAITSTSFVAGAINSTAIEDSALTANKIATDAITASKIASNALTTDEIADGVFTKVWAESTRSITLLPAGIITSTAFAAGALNSTAIADDAITAGKIASNAITTDELTDGVFTKVWAESTRSKGRGGNSPSKQ